MAGDAVTSDLFSKAVHGDPPVVLSPEEYPDVEHLVTEDDTPVDNVFSEKQQRLLTESLYSSWDGRRSPDEQPRPFVAMANVGLFFAIRRPALVPDMLLKVGVEMPENLRIKSHRSYFVWEYDGKVPDVVVEVVSNHIGGENTNKLDAYAQIKIRYYVIYDADKLLGPEALRVYRFDGVTYQRMQEPVSFPDLGLGLRVWQGLYEDQEDAWLRWVDASGNLILTGREGIMSERQRAERLAEKLRQLGVDPTLP